jgi:hypothetical protein
MAISYIKGDAMNLLRGAWSDLGQEALPTLADYYKVKISDQVHDVSKHYKTTYTTYTTTWSW